MTTAILSTYSAGYNLNSPVDTLSIASSGTVAGSGVITNSFGVYTVVNAGTIAAAGTYAGVDLAVGGVLTNVQGHTISGYQGLNIGSAYEGSNYTASATVTNNGVILGGTGARSFGVYLGYNLALGVLLTNGNASDTSALISGNVGVYDQVGVFSLADSTITNFATIQGTGGGSYAGIEIVKGTRATIVNGTTLDTSALITGAVGINLSGDGQSTIQNFGTIQGTGGTAVSLGSHYDLLIDEANADFIGTVQGAGGSLTLAGDAGAGTLSGLGTSFADFGQVSVDAGATWTLTGSNSIASGDTLTNNGTLAGSGALTIDPATMINSGYVGLTVTLGSGSYLDNTETGTIMVSGGPAVYGTGGSVTVVNAGTITATSDEGLLLGEGGNVANNGTEAQIYGNFSGVYIGGDAGTVTNAGTIIGARYFGVNLGNGGTVTNGSDGATTALLSGRHYGVRVAGAAGTVTNYGMIGSTNTGVELGLGGIVTNVGTISGSGGLGVYLVDGGTVDNGNGTATGASIVGYSGGVRVGNGATTTTAAVSNYGTIEATTNFTAGYGVEFYSAGTITNGSVGSPSALIEGYSWGLRLGINSPPITGSTVANFGTIAATATTGGFGIDLNDGGNVANGSPVSTGAAILGSRYGIYSFGGTVGNYGTVRGGYTGVEITGAGDDVLTNGGSTSTAAVITGQSGVSLFAGTITNFGLIDATQSGTGGPSSYFGALLLEGGSIGNFGTIEAVGSTGYGVTLNQGGTVTNGSTAFRNASIYGQLYGLLGVGLAATIVNYGTIAGATGMDFTNSPDNTVVDAGTIAGSGGTAIRFGAGGNRLILENGYKLTGGVTASGSGNVLELRGSADNAVTANYSALGLVGIGTIGFSAGAGNYATLKITNTAVLPGTIAGFTGAHDAIDLTTLSDAGNDAIASLNTVTDVLTIFGDDGSVQLQLDNEAYPGFTVRNDGGNGTEVLAGGSPPSVTEALVSDTGSSASDKVTSDPAVTGGGDAGATVTIKQGITTLGTTTASGSGAWSFTPSGLADGLHTLVASETNIGGTGTASLTFTLDTTAPAVTEALMSDTGSSASDKITSDPTVTGGGDADATVTITEGGLTLGTSTANESGVWSFIPSGLADGSNTLVASETDLAGNTGSASLTFTLDTTAPAVTEALMSDTGSSASDKITSNPAVTGGGDADTTVTITEGGSALGTVTANGAGVWSFTPSGLADGSNTLVASETDLAGNTGSASLTFTLDTVAPAVTETLVSDTGASASDKITSNPAVTGGGDADTTVTIAEGGLTLGTTTANASGVWSFTPSGLAEGSNTLVASETDLAGNTGSASLTFTLDTVAPAVAIANSGVVTHQANQAISGTVSDVDLSTNPTVAIFDNGTEIGSAAASGGIWSTSVTFSVVGSNVLTAEATDIAGNTGTSVPVGFTYVSGYVVSSGQDLVVSSGQTDTPITVLSGGRVDVLSGGTAAATTISGGRVVVSAGGTATSTTLGSGGVLELAGGSDPNLVWLSGGEVVVGSGPVSGGFMVSGGQVLVVSGGTTSATEVASGGAYYVDSGATVTGAAIGLGGVGFVESGGVASGTTVGGGTQVVYGADTGTVITSGGTEDVETGGTAQGTAVDSGVLVVLGTASGVTVGSGGADYVSPGGAVNGTTVIGGDEFVEVGGSATFTVLSGGATQVVYGVATGTIIDGGSTEDVEPGGTAQGAMVNSGVLVVLGTASGTTVGSGGADYVMAGGSVSGTIVTSGDEFVEAGGSASFTMLGGGATQVVYGIATSTVIAGSSTENVEAGGTAFGAVVDDGALVVLGIASGSTVGSEGADYVMAGGTASDTIVTGGDEFVETGGFVANTTVSGGVEVVYGLASGGTLGSGGFQIVESGGTANAASVNSGGEEEVVSGGTIGAAAISGGTVELASGAGLAGGAIDFAVNGGGILLLDDSQHFSGTVAGFGLPDALDLADIAFGPGTGLGFQEAGGNASGTLTVSNGTDTANLTLLGQYVAGQFIIGGDGHGGTMVTAMPLSATAGLTAPLLAASRHG